MKKVSSIITSLILICTIALTTGCEKDNETAPKSSNIACKAGKSSMSWSIKSESGPKETTSNCRNDWHGNSYIQTCDGTIKYFNSGKSYSFHAVYNWIDGEISVTVYGEGSCEDSVDKSKSVGCGCDLENENSIIVYKEYV